MPWRLVRGLRIVVACLALWLASTPSPVVVDVASDVIVLAQTEAPRAIASPQRASERRIRVPHRQAHCLPAPHAIDIAAPAFDTPAPSPTDIFLLNCALLC
jgi:hypothetical protein